MYEKFDSDGVFVTEPLQKGHFVDPNAIGAIRDPKLLHLRSGNSNWLTRLTPYHGRSFVDYKSQIFTEGTVTDENGDCYTDFNTKGNDFSDPKVSLYEIEPQGVRINGAQDASLFERCRGVSELLRKAGVLCEWPIAYGRPARYPLPFSSETCSTNVIGLKNAIYKNIVQNEQRIPIGVAAALGVIDTDFGVSYRAVLTNYRLMDLRFVREQVSDTSGIEYVLWDAISALQERKPTHLSAWNKLETLDPNSEQDQKNYLTEILPSIMGENLAKAHNEGVWFKYPHAGNWSVAGEIVDLDSAQCTLLFDEDEPASPSNTLFDLFRSLESLEDTFQGDDKAILKAKSEFIKHYYSERLHESIPDIELVALESLLMAYSGLDEGWREAETIIDFMSFNDEEITVSSINTFLELAENEDIYKKTLEDGKVFMKEFIDKITPSVLAIVESRLSGKLANDTTKINCIAFITPYECMHLFNKTLAFLKTCKPDFDNPIELH